MKVVILGSGVIGVTTAYYLVKAGHEVVVLDRQPGPALETSFANAGEVSPGYSAPWAAPGIPIKALKWLFMRHRPLVIWPKPDPAMWVWGLMMLRNCTAARYELNKGRMLPIAGYSRDLLRALRAETGIAYDERAKGTLQLFRTQKQMDGVGNDTAILDRFDVPYEVLDAEGCIGAEPALALVREKIAGGLRLPGDETGDCFRFTSELEKLAGQLGVRFQYGTLDRRHRDRRAAASPACAPTAARLRATPTSPRWAAIRQRPSARSAFASRSTRSRATRSPCRSPTARPRPCRP